MRRILAGLLVVLGGTATLAAPALAVDGVIEINQARALKGGITPGDTPGFPVTISVSGSYRLTSNLTVPDASTSGIVVTVNEVTIDLNGFAIVGPVTCTGGPPVVSCSPTGTGGSGISGPTSAEIRVLDGQIRGLYGFGVNVGSSALVRDVTVRWAAGGGISVGSGSVVSRSTVLEGGFVGITSGPGSVISGNVVRSNLSTGIQANGGSTLDANTVMQNGYGIVVNSPGGGGTTVVGNSISANSSIGLQCSGPVDGYTQNVLSLNNGGGVQVSGCTSLGAGTNLCNSAPCP